MKKVLVIIGRLVIGGAEKVGRDIGFYADASEFKVDYLVFGKEIGSYEKELEEKGCRVFHFAPPSDGHLKFYRAIKNLIKTEGYSVVHCHTMFNSGLVMRAAYKCNVPIRISHSHSIRGFEKRRFIKNFYEKTMRRLVLKYSTHYCACGVAAGEWLFGKKAFDKRGIVLLNGVDSDKFSFNAECRERIRKDLGVKDGFIIGHVGHFATVKNQIYLIRLMPEILKIKKNAVLLLLGDGNDRKLLKEEVSLFGLENHVVMPGNVHNVNEYLSAMDVFAFPSLYEGMPLALLEVQANGLCAVVSDKVPKDVFVTDLIERLSLDDKEGWINALTAAERKNSESYCEEIKKSGFDVSGLLEKIYDIYRGK